MAVMPGVRFMNAATSSLMSRYDIVCIHTIVGYAPAHAAHFSTNASGFIYQSRDTKYRSAANLNGNYRVISIENEDHGLPAFPSWGGSNVPGFTAAQIEAIAKICAWAHKTHGIPLVLAPDSKPTSRGIAYHRQGCDGNFAGYAYGGRVPGGELWSSAYGKVCPGDRRIKQLIEQIIPRARVLAGLSTPTPIKENEVELTDRFDDSKVRLQPGTVGHKILGTWQFAQGARIAAENNARALAGLQAAFNKLVDVVAKGDSVNATELKAAVKEAIAESVVKVDVTVDGVQE